MLADLKTLVDAIRDAVSDFAGFRSKRARLRAIRELFCIYFLMLDVTTEGSALLEAVGNNPRKTIDQTPEMDQAETLLQWRAVICRQASRLHSLAGGLLGQDALAIFDPHLKARLEKIVSSKFKRIDSLRGVGACLVWYSALADPKDQDYLRSMILSMYPAKGRATIDLKAARRELKNLSAALEEFRVVCTKLATDDEIFAISTRARRETEWSEGKIPFVPMVTPRWTHQESLGKIGRW